MALPQRRQLPSQPVTGALATFMWFSPALLVVAWFLKLPAVFLWLFGIPTGLFGLFLLLGSTAGASDEVWERYQAPSGFTFIPYDQDLPSRLWPDGPDPTGRPAHERVGHIVSGEVGGRETVFLRRLGHTIWIDFVMVRLDGKLPPVDLDYQAAFATPDNFHVEDAEFNARFKVNGRDTSPATARYLHQVLHPVMVNLLLSEEPMPWRIRGDWISTTARGLTPEETVADALEKAAFLAQVADLIPAHVYADFGDRRG